MRWDLISNLVLGFFLFGVSMLILQAGRTLFGADANILWASGFLTWIGLKGIVEAFRPFINKRFAKAVEGDQ